MNVGFLSSNPLNSTIVDTSTGATLFVTSTPFRLGKRTTTLYNGQRQVVAVYKRRWGHDRVTIRGETRQLSEWLSHNWWSHSRQIYAPNGKVYIWKKPVGSSSLRLVDRHSKRTVAKAHRSHHALFGASQKISIDVESEAVPMLDAVVLSFAICEEKRRRDETAAVTAADSA